MPQTFFYDNQMRRFLLQFIRAFSNFQVEYGKDRDGQTTLLTVPVKYGDATRLVSNIIRDNSENKQVPSPMMSVYITAMEYARDRMQEPTFVECKHTYDSNKMVDVAERYMPQIQWYMFLSNLDGCYLSVIFGNRRWEATYIKKNWSYINELKLLAKKFWSAIVEDKSPVVEDKPILSIDDIELNDMIRVGGLVVDNSI